MKKVFLSLAVIAALTVVSCKQADANADAAADTTAVEAPADTAAVEAPADTTAAPAADTTAAPAAAPAEKK